MIKDYQLMAIECVHVLHTIKDYQLMAIVCVLVLQLIKDYQLMAIVYVLVLQVIKDYQLMAIVCVLVGLDVTILCVWEFTDPLKVVRMNKTKEIMVRL